ncbi:transcriptional regulator, GntR family [Roseovarius marisflavi]|uniref:Transcriptional regulator, GntR family n=1 Tax=Roseovarius marisflavi TaxID=1054996 RepID=A0A1M6YZZ1_9RHOB|nr:FCD domain-containing protein [Roseovarius marisflavi]SHL23629.1 transcriptional regulator, GntR family [Roseovarius marisflavi]
MNKPIADKTARIVSEQPIGATVQTVVDTLFARIKSDEYTLDARLPSERTLATELGVARNTVREALDVLETHDVIRRRAGSGSFVTYQSNAPRNVETNTVADDTSPLNHLVVRGILEPEIVRLAVINMTPRMITELSNTLSQIEAVQTSVDDFIELEERLYTQIAEGTGNPLLASCYNLAIETYRQSFRNKLRRRALTPKRMQDYQKRYNTLFNAIASRDVASAVEFIKLHLVEEQQLLLQDL